MNNIIVRNSSGLYLIVGQGLVGNAINATRMTAEDAARAVCCGNKFGFANLSTETAVVESWAVVYVRKGDTFTGGQLVKGSPSSNLNQFDPSKRRFATRAEAITHGKRFDTRRANKTDPVGSGTAGHNGFFVVKTGDAVNSKVNPATGLTNRL